MKPINWLLWSLVLNAVLTIAMIIMATRPPTVETVMNPRAVSPAKVASPETTAPSSSDGPNSTDWRNWLGQLRDAGVPDKVLAGLVVADFENRAQKQHRDLQRRYNRGEVDDYAITRQAEEHDADEEAELKAALGSDGFLKWDKEKVLQDFDGVELSASEGDALYQLRKNLTQTQRNLQEKNLSGEIDQSDLDGQQAVAENEYNAKVKSLLGDSRFATLQNPEDGAQAGLVRALKNMNVGDAQIQAVLQAQQQWNQNRAELDDQKGGQSSEQTQTLEATRDAEYQNLLGADGFSELQKMEDNRYQAMEHYASAWQLSGNDVNYIYDTLRQSEQNVQDYQQQAHALEAQGQTVDWQAVEANVQTFTQQTQQSLRSYLGDDRFNKLDKNSIFVFTSE